jgi:prophage DNA circulation protein
VNDEIREQLVRVRTLAVSFLSSESINLPELRTYTTTAETDAFDLAWLLYGDASRWEDVVARNALQNPALVPAGTEIEYIEAA